MKYPMRAFATALLLLTIALTITQTNQSASAQEKALADRLELTSVHSDEIQFSLSDNEGKPIASGHIISSRADNSQTFTVSDPNGQLAQITIRQIDESRGSVNVTSRKQHGEWNFDSKQIGNLHASLAASTSLKRLDAESRNTLRSFVQARKAMLEAIGPVLRDRLLSALATQHDTMEGQALARALAGQQRLADGSGQRVDCWRAFEWYYFVCTNNGNSQFTCAMWAINEWLSCLSDTEIGPLEL